MATIAPVVVSVALWLLTGSVFALVFAALGPAVAVASLADARLQSRRRLRREQRRFAVELAAARHEMVEAHDRERAALERSTPSSRHLVDSTWSDSEKWLAKPDDPVEVGIGAGDGASTLSLDGLPAASRSRSTAEVALREIDRAARTLDRAPLVVDARLGIGVVGAPVVAESVARALVVQLAATLSPVEYSIAVEAPDERLGAWSWIEQLPHHTRLAPGGTGDSTGIAAERAGPHAVGRAPTAVASVAVAGKRADLPRTARVVVRAGGATGAIEQHPDATSRGTIRLDHVSLEQARQIAATLHAQAERARLAGRPTGDALPGELAFAQLATARLPTPPGTPDGGGLGCAVAVCADGPLILDLVAHGPHAVVGGTTGSGKSELLTGWVLAMARDYSPRRVSVLLVDFKGGSAFAGLAALPHCVGVITDLDETGAVRALESLAAELRRRERHLAAVGAKSIDHLPEVEGVPVGHHSARAGLPRLVIVVDEFAAMVAGFPELHALFGDIAARGRSLGVHLILCTQRPAGVIRDAVLANSGLRVSLRVNNRADSSAVIGVDVASALPLQPRGRAYVSTDGDEPVLAQFPLASPIDIEAVTQRWAGERYRAHRPWLDPLPAEIPLAVLADPLSPGPLVPNATSPDWHSPDSLARAAALPFGLLDDPANQSQPIARYRPDADGNLLVTGGAGSGKSTLLETLGAAAEAANVRLDRVPSDIEGAWDALEGILARIRGSAPPNTPGRLVLIDDLDQLLGRFADEYEAALLDTLVQSLREGPGCGVRFVITAQRHTAALHQVGSLCGSRLLLPMPNRQEHVLAGGDGSDFVERARPGRGRWRGLAVQVARATAVHDRADRVPGPHSLSGPESPGEPQALPQGLPQPGPQTRTLDYSLPLAVVSSRPAAFVARLRRALPDFALPGAVVDIAAHAAATPGAGHTTTIGAPGPQVGASGVAVTTGRRPVALVGDPDAWQAKWGALQGLQSTHVVIVDGLGAAEFRAVTRTRTLPPPLDDRNGAFWLCSPDGSVRRAHLP